MSPSSRRAWIEMSRPRARCRSATVALLAEGVDRNLTKENRTGGGFKVALLAEGVDRNRVELDAGGDAIQSPSSRRAWIEMSAAFRLKK